MLIEAAGTSKPFDAIADGALFIAAFKDQPCFFLKAFATGKDEQLTSYAVLLGPRVEIHAQLPHLYGPGIFKGASLFAVNDPTLVLDLNSFVPDWWSVRAGGHITII